MGMALASTCVLLALLDLDGQIDRADAEFLDPACVDRIRLLHRQLRQRRADRVQVSPKVNQRTEEHIPRDAAERVDVQMYRHNADHTQTDQTGPTPAQTVQTGPGGPTTKPDTHDAQESHHEQPR